jgi:hypothetical protein
MPTQRSLWAFSTLICLPLIAVVVGNAAARSWASAAATSADTADPAATATRQAELAELAALRTEIADLQTEVARLSTSPTASATPSPTATPAATVTPTPVPPALMNRPLSYEDAWTVTVTDVTKEATVRGSNNSATAKGVYVVVRATLVNNEGENRRFSVGDLVLIDDQARRFEAAVYETIMVSENYSQTYAPVIPTDTAWVFDVAPDVGDHFILESGTDPAFRVQLDVVRRG